MTKNQLLPLPSTTILPPRGPALRREKWLICDAAGEALTCEAGRPRPRSCVPHPDEKALQRQLQAEFPAHQVVSRPDPRHDGRRVRFEAWVESLAAEEKPLAPVAVRKAETTLALWNELAKKEEVAA